MKSYTVILSLLLIPMSVSAEQIKFIVTGKVVRNDGIAVANALVVIHPPGLVGELAFGATTDGTGKFKFEGDYEGKNEIIYVTSPLPEDACVPLIPPFNHLDPTFYFTGKKIHVEKGQKLDLGDIRVQNEYRYLTLYLRDQSGKPLLTTPEEWEIVWIRIRERSGKRVEESGLSEKDRKIAVNLEDSAIRLAIPEGVWRIEVAPKGYGTNWYSSDVLTVTETQPQDVIIKCK